MAHTEDAAVQQVQWVSLDYYPTEWGLPSLIQYINFDESITRLPFLSEGNCVSHRRYFSLKVLSCFGGKY